MPFNVQISEPQPHGLANHKIHTGRGGAGNTTMPYPTSKPTSTLRHTSNNNNNSSSHLSHMPTHHSTISTTTTSSKFSSGRGGAGNMHPISAASPASFDDELASLSRREDYDTHNAWHVGRGGAGNWAKGDGGNVGARRKSSAGSSTSSVSGSERSSGWMARLSSALER
ncbi:MAG: hypothetical protein M1818_003843 [Claussenomyces sp. TS43310]|nr:MAG: hypothetical protein M1818_003843 [Claussenomyces sp. TS43310]